MTQTVFGVFYRWCAFPLGFLVTHLLWPLIPQKLANSLKAKWKQRYIGQSKPAILIHTASGEIEYAKPFIRELKLREPSLQILISYSSPSLLELYKPSEDELLVCLPFDFLFTMKRFLKKYRVTKVFIARSDLWPSMLLACKQMSIDTFLFSTTQSKSADDLSLGSRLFYSYCYSLINHISTVSALDLKNILSIYPNAKAEATGDTRYDQVFYRLAQDKKLPKPILISKEQSHLVGGSLWYEDEQVIVPALSELFKASVCVTLVPHEVNPQSIDKLTKLCRQNQISYQLYSKIDTDQYTLRPGEVLIFDVFGFLADLYKQADIAFVGGSFWYKIHSVMEPLACGAFVLIGPLHQNNREAIEFQKIQTPSLRPVVTVVKNSEEFKAATLQIQKVLSFDEKIWIQSTLKEKTGATQKLIEYIRSPL